MSYVSLYCLEICPFPILEHSGWAETLFKPRVRNKMCCKCIIYLHSSCWFCLKTNAKDPTPFQRQKCPWEHQNVSKGAQTWLMLENYSWFHSRVQQKKHWKQVFYHPASQNMFAEDKDSQRNCASMGGELYYSSSKPKEHQHHVSLETVWQLSSPENQVIVRNHINVKKD